MSESDAAAALAFIPPDVLPQTFGGAAPPLPVDEAVRKFGLAKPAQIAVPGKARPTACRRCPLPGCIWRGASALAMRRQPTSSRRHLRPVQVFLECCC